MSGPPTKFDPQTVWFVTGCSSGLGKAFAKKVYCAGHRVVATARNVAALSYLPDEPTVLKLSLDVTCGENILSSLTHAVNQFGRIDVVINNAGYGLMGDTEAIEEADARHQLETNFWGPARITQETLKIFREVNPRGQGGTVVQVSSMGGWMTAPGHAFYHASKFALEGFTESIAKEMNPDWNIKFLIIAPGGVRTNFAGSGLKLVPRHPAYESPTSQFSQLIEYITNPASQETWSDPDVCAQLLFDAVTGQKGRPLPTRLLMGAETIPLIKADIQQTLREIDAWSEEAVRCSPKGGAHLDL
ncbi:NAD(P)-binding protein [Aspergillus steynii IBT 23096]|uniref:NAD(P)-binding protein n=1 Tax=Aspergillus steynii IBT 23096 TaxID=1392250 RepID=A0A2I2GBG5_9EURO|nr:NAD(P)-binding protein [Aspergillus steynii IBT 23096]PLB50214.1 NAD(P)-binding protein [Aspergillus steynii IBT 23096]